MTTPSFPALLKPVVSKGYSFQQPANVVEQPVAGGLPLMMLDYKTAAVPFSVVLVLTRLRLQVWQDFYFAKIASGSAKFTMMLDSGNGLEENICNLVPSSVQISTQSQETWIVTFTVLAEKTAAQDLPFEGNLSELFDVYGDDILTIFDRLAIFALDDISEVFA